MLEGIKKQFKGEIAEPIKKSTPEAVLEHLANVQKEKALKKMESLEHYKSIVETETEDAKFMTSKIVITCHTRVLPLINCFLSEISSIGIENVHETMKKADFDAKEGEITKFMDSIKVINELKEKIDAKELMKLFEAKTG